MVNGSIDLDAYFARIGHTGGRKPTLDTLRAIHACHTDSIPFENLNPLLKLPVRLDLPSLEKKLLHNRRGGYCFEQNKLLLHALTAIGYSAIGLAARVLWNAPEGYVGPRTHMLLLIDLEGLPYIADVGFGGQTLTGPLRLEPGTEQAEFGDPFRILSIRNDFLLQSKIQGVWKSLYQFDLREQHQVDYEVASWYVSTHQESHFLHNLLAARRSPGCRYALRNNDLAIHRAGRESEHLLLGSVAELREALGGAFGLALPDLPELDQVLARFATKPA